MQSEFKPTFIHRVSRWAYSVALVMLIPLVLGGLYVNSIRKNKAYRKRMSERFGAIPTPSKPNGYLFHCVSVGEVVTASCVIKELMDKEPNTAFTITTTTPTGSARAKALFGDKVNHFYLPYDMLFLMQKMIKRIKPKQVLVTEVELWPNLIHTCWQAGIPVTVINARMTDRSAKRYANWKNLFVAMLHKLTHICAQGQRDYDNYLSLGVSEQKLTLTKNIKFDQAGSLLADSNNRFLNLVKGDRLTIVGGSTHEGEESALLKALEHVYHKYKPRLVLVPRHPERFKRVSELLTASKFSWSSTTQCSSISEDCDVLLVDEMGRLTEALAIADIAYVGGSLVSKGGHNALEPAAKAVPIIMGPYTYNNPQISIALSDVGALRLVENETELLNILRELLAAPQLRAEMGKAGQQVLRQNQGAVAQTLRVLQSIV